MNREEKELDSPLSPEDQFLLELLVDGELDDPNRRDLLLRLDRIPGGWRCCAIAFLEAQAFKEGVCETHRRILAGAETKENREDALSDGELAQTVFVSVKDIPDSTPASPLSAPTETVKKTSFRPEMLGGENPNCERVTSIKSEDRRARPSEYFTPKTDGSAALDSALESERLASGLGISSFQSETDDSPMIIPIHGGRFRSSRWGQNFRRGLSRSGISLRSLFGAVSCGFLLAIGLFAFLGGFVQKSGPFHSTEHFAENSIPAVSEYALGTPSAETPENLAANEKMMAKSGADSVSHKNDTAKGLTVSSSPSDRTILRPEKSVLADSEMDSEGESQQAENSPRVRNGEFYADLSSLAESNEEGNLPVRQVTLKRSQGDSGISVPCVEAETYDPEILRRHSSESYAESLRQSGCEVDSLYEEVMFPLKDGRRLIVPVDTIRIKRPAKTHYQ